MMRMIYRLKSLPLSVIEYLEKGKAYVQRRNLQEKDRPRNSLRDCHHPFCYAGACDQCLGATFD
jgi:hypothetical protein